MLYFILSVAIVTNYTSFAQIRSYYARILLFAFALLLFNNFVSKINASLTVTFTTSSRIIIPFTVLCDKL